MIKGRDILVLVDLLVATGDRTVREIAADTSLDVAGVHRSLRQLGEVGLLGGGRNEVVRPAAAEFLIHAVKYLYPATLGPLSRGVPAAWGMSPLVEMLAPSTEIPVWPHPLGTVRGPSLEPVHPAIPDVAKDRPAHATLFGLIDSIRAGDARIRALATDELRHRIEDAA